MGTGATISTGGSTKHLSGTINNGESYYNKNQNPYTYGIVISVNSDDRSIQYRPIIDNLASAKIGNAIPFYKNNTQLPQINEIVPLLKGPDITVGNQSQSYDKAIYYLNSISVQQTVNDNFILENNNTNNLDVSKNGYKNNELGVKKNYG